MTVKCKKCGNEDEAYMYIEDGLPLPNEICEETNSVVCLKCGAFTTTLEGTLDSYELEELRADCGVSHETRR